MGIDGSDPVVAFSYTVPAGFSLRVSRAILYLEASTAFDSIKFMNLTALTNGVLIYAGDDLLTTWKDNIDIILDMFDLTSGAAFGKETRTLAGRWSFYKLLPGFGTLSLTAGQIFKAVIQDDLSAANIVFRIKIQGELRSI